MLPAIKAAPVPSFARPPTVASSALLNCVSPTPPSVSTAALFAVIGPMIERTPASELMRVELSKVIAAA